MQKFDVEYWDKLFVQNKIGWDIGYPSPPLVEYFDQLTDKDIKILIPGAGNAYEAEYLYLSGFQNVYVLDFSEQAVNSFKKRCPDFPDEKIILDDFFEHTEKYNLIVEQTFFTSFEPEKRQDFAKKIADLLFKGGKYVGLFFTHEFGKDYPPFGANKQVYIQLFRPYFDFKIFEIAYNSIKPRRNREYFFVLERR
jgi:thiopurine S-methyltransferase